MAPEIVEQKAYKGEKVDIFSAGVILFILVTGNFPFKKAKNDDFLFKFIIKKDWNTFWMYHENGKSVGSFS